MEFALRERMHSRLARVGDRATKGARAGKRESESPSDGRQAGGREEVGTGATRKEHEKMKE